MRALRSRRPRGVSETRLTRFGGQMRAIRSSRRDVHWLQGPGPTDLWTWTEGPEGPIVMQELSFCGRCVLRRDGRISTGVSSERGDSAYGDEMALHELDVEQSLETLEAARTLLDAIPPDERGPRVEVFATEIGAELDRRQRETASSRDPERDYEPHI